MLLTDVAIKNRTTVAVLGLLIILMGGYSYLTLPREAAPDIPIPFILVTTIYEGVSPEDMELFRLTDSLREACDVIEKARCIERERMAAPIPQDVLRPSGEGTVVGVSPRRRARKTRRR